MTIHLSLFLPSFGDSGGGLGGAGSLGGLWTSQYKRLPHRLTGGVLTGFGLGLVVNCPNLG